LHIYTTRTFYFTYRLLSYVYSMAYSSDFVIIIQDKTTTSVISWHQVDTQVVLDSRLVGPIRSFTVFTIYGYSTEFAILRVLTSSSRSTMVTSIYCRSDVISSCTVAAYT